MKHYGRVEWMGLRYCMASPQIAKRILSFYKAKKELLRLMMKQPFLLNPHKVINCEIA